jgi:nicotinate-nucleotide adenylyltransferase
MTVAILGGRFDPPHIGHYLIAQQTLELYPHIDILLLVPASHHQWKPNMANEAHRLAMTKLLATHTMRVSDIEIQRGGISYTKDTLQEVQAQYRTNKIYWIVGTDIVNEYGKWENTQGMDKLATFLVFPRDPYHLSSKLPLGFELLKSKSLITTNLSSTHIRERIKNKQSISHLVPQNIEEYIKEHDLYTT